MKYQAAVEKDYHQEKVNVYVKKVVYQDIIQ
jgi:hypothetical protein